MVLAAVLGQAVYRLDGCIRGPSTADAYADISQTFKCFGRRMVFENHDLLSRVAATPAARFAAKLRTRRMREVRQDLPVGTGHCESFEGGEDLEHILSRVLGPFHHFAGRSM